MLKKVSFGLFDTGETILGALVFSTFFPLFITEHVDTKLYSLLYGLSFLFSFFMALLLGKLADKRAIRKHLFGVFSVLTATLCFGVGIAYPSPLISLSFFLLMAVSHQQALVFYNSLLLGFSSKGFTSGMGVAFGYVGSAFALIFLGETLKEPQVYLLTSLLFFILFLPSILVLDNPKETEDVDLRSLLTDRRFLLLIVSILTVTEVANTLVAMMGIYLREVYSLGRSEILTTIGLSAVGGVGGGLLWGYLTDRFGVRRIFPLGFFLWAVLLLILPFTPREMILGVGLLAGLSLSHVWTTSRVLMLSEFPAGQASVRMSFLSLTERVASTTGLVLWSLLLYLTGENFKLSASLMALLPVAGFLISRRVLK